METKESLPIQNGVGRCNPQQKSLISSLLLVCNIFTAILFINKALIVERITYESFQQKFYKSKFGMFLEQNRSKKQNHKRYM